jgi:heme/copper-type cytochrome/quinol oxidase subunit 3
MLFVAGLGAWLLVKIARDLEPIELPVALFLALLPLLGVSVLLELACRAVQRDALERLRIFLGVALGLGLVFLLVQIPSLVELLSRHNARKEEGNPLFGLAFFLVLLHALHVLGGVAALIRTTLRARDHAYDHERSEPVRYLTLYWHFLDVVWVVMLLVMG